MELHRRDLKNPVCVLKGEITGLPFPSASEIVLEGFVEPDDERAEGRSAISTAITRQGGDCAGGHDPGNLFS